MNLVIDLGNTYAKAWIVSASGEHVLETRLEARDFSSLEKLVLGWPTDDLPVKAAILSSVIDHPRAIEELLKDRFYTVVLDHTTPLPVLNKYSTPETLGKDRIASVVGASLRFRNENALVIDAGTCIKYDMLTSAGEYLGGGISPGIDMRFKALNTFTDKLPLLTQAKSAPLIGTSTEGSILSGVQNGAMEEVKGIIARYEVEFRDLKVVLTGGDMNFFLPLVSGKNAIFADPWLVLKGLNAILEHNASNNT
jgi:type III pantothenate kinase